MQLRQCYKNETSLNADQSFPTDFEPQSRRDRQKSPQRRRSFKYDSYRPPPPSNSQRHEPSLPPKASDDPNPGSDNGPSSSRSKPRPQSPPKRPTAAFANNTEASRTPAPLTLRQSIGQLASTITQAASISARKDLLAREAWEQNNVYKSQLKHKDNFTTLFEEAAFRAAQAERSSQRVKDEMKEVQLAQNAAVEKLTEALWAGRVTETTQQPSNADQPSEKTQEALKGVQGSLDEIRIDIDFLNRNTITHDKIDSKLALYATKQQLLEIAAAKAQVPDKDPDLQKLLDMEKKYLIALDHVKSKLAELEQKSGNQDNQINVLEGRLEPVMTDLVSHHARVTSIEQTPSKADQGVTAESDIDMFQTAEQAKKTEEDRIESMDQKLNALDEELRKVQAMSGRAEESAPSNFPDHLLDKALETTAAHFRNEMDKRGQFITDALSELSSNLSKVAQDLDTFRTDVQTAQAQQRQSPSFSRINPPAMTVPPATSAPVAAAAAATAPTSSLPSAVAPNTGDAPLPPTASGQSASPLPNSMQPVMELFKNTLEQYSSRSAGEVESLRLFVTGLQQKMDGLRGAVEQIWSVHPVQVSAHIHRLQQGQLYLEQQQKVQTKELEVNLRKVQTAETDPLRSQLELSQKMLKQLEGQVLNLSQSASAFKTEQDEVVKNLIRDIQDSKNPVVELNDRVNTAIGRMHIDISSLNEQIAILKSEAARSSTVVAPTNNREDSADQDSDEPIINRTRPTEKRPIYAAISNNKRKVHFDSSDDNDEPLAAATRKLDRVVKRMNVSKRGDTAG